MGLRLRSTSTYLKHLSAASLLLVSPSLVQSQTLKNQYRVQTEHAQLESESCKERLSRFNYALPSLEWGYNFRTKNNSLSGNGLAIFRVDEENNIFATTDDLSNCPGIEEHSLGKVGSLWKWKDGYEQQFIFEDGRLCQYSKLPVNNKITRSCLVKQDIYPYKGTRQRNEQSVYPFRTDDMAVDFEKYASNWLKKKYPAFESVVVKHLDQCKTTTGDTAGYECNFGNLEARWKYPSTGSISCILSDIRWSQKAGIAYKGDCNNEHFYPLQLPIQTSNLLDSLNADQWVSWVEAESWLRYRTDRPFRGQKAKLSGSHNCLYKKGSPESEGFSRSIKCTGNYKVNDNICTDSEWGMILDKQRSMASIVIISSTQKCSPINARTLHQK